MENETETVKFAVIVDGEVIASIAYQDSPPHDKIIAAIRTGVTYIEVQEAIEVGSTWDGTSFTPPVE